MIISSSWKYGLNSSILGLNPGSLIAFDESAVELLSSGTSTAAGATGSDTLLTATPGRRVIADWPAWVASLLWEGDTFDFAAAGGLRFAARICDWSDNFFRGGGFLIPLDFAAAVFELEAVRLPLPDCEEAADISSKPFQLYPNGPTSETKLQVHVRVLCNQIQGQLCPFENELFFCGLYEVIWLGPPLTLIFA